MSFKVCLPRHELGIVCANSLSLLAVCVGGGGGGGGNTDVKQANRDEERMVRATPFFPTRRLVQRSLFSSKTEKKVLRIGEL